MLRITHNKLKKIDVGDDYEINDYLRLKITRIISSDASDSYNMASTAETIVEYDLELNEIMRDYA